MAYKCKLCEKKYPCGRSLGGHMRSHMHPEGTEKPGSRKCFIAPTTGYGQRKIPKRTWSISNPGSREMHGSVCSKSGTGFYSKNSLFGHIKSRSATSVVEEVTDLEEEERGDNEETVYGKRRRRSRRMASISEASSLQFKFDQEQEDVAFALIMLSEGVELADSLSPAGSSESKIVVPNSDSMDISSNVDQRNDKINLEFDVSDAAFDEDDHKLPIYRNTDEASTDCRSKDSKSTKKDAFDVCDAQTSTKHMEIDLHKIHKPKKQYSCVICNKSFRSYQALGGHQSSHDRAKRYHESRAEGNTCKNSMPVKKMKDFSCPICCKAFSSGQALGGHKRSHFLIKSRYEGSPASQYKMVIQAQPFVVLDMPDPNLPASDKGDDVPR